MIICGCELQNKSSQEKLEKMIDEDFDYLASKMFSETDVSFYRARFGRNFDAKSLKDWFYDYNETKVVYDHEMHRENHLDIADNVYAKNGGKGEKIIKFGVNFMNDSRIERLGTLIHERRHFDIDYSKGSVYLHTECTTPGNSNLNDEKKCDENLNGPLGYQIAFLAMIAKYCVDCSNEEKRTAKNAAIDRVDRILDSELRAEAKSWFE